jgi:crotonobetainyl-CoA:carnitine CoA-transferase CaiB-like acyl-CoA transferase
MLSCYRVLDLTDEKGFFCGRVLADLGADVIKIEKPGGDPARSIGPFYHDIVDPEKSLYWFAFNANKRSITLDIETTDGREIFKKLVRTADVVIESFSPGYLENLGLGYPVLNEINPKVIMTSVTGFGQEGPYRDFKAPDIVVRALGGMIYTVGEPDRPPLTTSYHHSYLIGAVHGAIGTMVALYQRSFTGRGQQVDAPTQQGLAFVGNVELQLPWILQHIIPERYGRKRFPLQLKDGSLYYQPVLWKCQDGDIAFTIAGAAMAASYPGFRECMKKDGIGTEPLEKWDWKKDNDGQWTKEDVEAILGALGEFFSRHTKAELLKMAQEKRIQLAPCLSAEEALQFPQFVARGFWTEVPHPELGTNITYPGGFVKLTGADCGIKRRAPLIGEHNDEIYTGELGFSKEELINLKRCRVI